MGHPDRSAGPSPLSSIGVDQPFLLILTGPPGAGKSTIGGLIAREFDRSVCIESDWHWTTIVNGFVVQWKTEADAQNQAVIRSFMASASRMVQGGYTTVVEGIVGPWSLDLVREELQEAQFLTYYVVLRPELAACLARARGRTGDERVPGHPPLTDDEPIRLLWSLFADLGELEHHVVDNTDLAAAQASEMIVGILERRGPEFLIT